MYKSVWHVHTRDYTRHGWGVDALVVHCNRVITLWTKEQYAGYIQQRLKASQNVLPDRYREYVACYPLRPPKVVWHCYFPKAMASAVSIARTVMTPTFRDRHISKSHAA